MLKLLINQTKNLGKGEVEEWFWWQVAPWNHQLSIRKPFLAFLIRKERQAKKPFVIPQYRSMTCLHLEHCVQLFLLT